MPLMDAAAGALYLLPAPHPAPNMPPTADILRGNGDGCVNRTTGAGATLASSLRNASALLAKHLRGPVQWTPAQQAVESVLRKANK